VLAAIVAPHVKAIVDDAIAQSDLKGEAAKRLSDTITPTIIVSLITGSLNQDAASYTSFELKYNFLTKEEMMEILQLQEKNSGMPR